MRKLLLSAALFTGLISNAQYVDMDKDATEFTMAETKELQSLPGAPNIVYLNVAGYYVYKNAPENVAQVVRLWRHAAENLRAFNVNVTTRRADWDNTPRANALFMNFNIHYAGGSCPLGLFGRGESWGGQNCHSAAQFYAFTHEIGHGLGIEHHWAPYDNVIGDGIKYTNVLVSKRDGGAYYSVWAKGNINDGEGTQDDIQTIANKLGFRPADHGSTTATATALSITNESVSKMENNGVIAQDGEVDMFKFTTQGGKIDLTVKPLKWYNSLHVKADVVDGEGNVVIAGTPIFHYDYSTWPEVDPGLQDEDEMNEFVKQGAEFKGELAAGNYYIRVTNSGYIDQYGAGYTSYSSFGYYEMEGTIESNPVGVEDFSANNDVQVFPNPATDFISIQTDKEYNLINIYDVKGSLVMTFEKSNKLDVSSLSSGEYLVKVLNNSTVVSATRVVVK